MAIYKYIDEKTGKTRYWLKGYIGVDPLTGKEKRVNRKGFASKKQAELELAKLQLGLNKPKEKTPKFKELYDSWLIPYKSSVKPSTFTTIQDLFRLHILPDFGDIFVDKITSDMVQEWVNKKYELGYSKFREFHVYLNKIMEIATARRHISFNPCNATIFPKRKEQDFKEDIIIWTKDELKEFLGLVEATKSIKWYAFFRLLAYTGMRRGEILALEWKDISFKNKTLTINKSRKVANNPDFVSGGNEPRKIEITGSTKTGDKRTIEIDSETLNILQEWKKKQVEMFGIQKIIFTNSEGDYLRLNYPIKVLNSITKKYHLREIDIHRFRHIHTTMLILANRNKNSLATIMQRLGHTDISTTLNIYNHIVKEEKEEILDNYINYIS